jgi:peptidoglycan/LPS O-acetylase OafA/YrhL
MSHSSLSATKQAAAQPPSEKPSRLYFVDHLRAALSILVVLHHVSLVYGASAPFYYVNPPFGDLLAFRVLLVFVLVNQSWFMGAFFLLAGYFTPGSYDRKGQDAFIRDRLLRLGIPLLVFAFLLQPISLIGWYLEPVPQFKEPLTWQNYSQMYQYLVGLGPTWFLAMLLVFAFGCAGWRSWRGKQTPAAGDGSPPGYLGILVFIVALAGVSFLVRTRIPIGKEVGDFPTLAYLPQYLSFFVVGIIAYWRDWLRRLPSSMGVLGLVLALVAAVVLFPLAFSGRMFSLELTEGLTNAMGGGHWQSAVYTLWDSLFAVGMCLFLITLFRRFFNEECSLGRCLARQSFAVYIIHIPLIVFITYAMRGIDLPSLPKFGLASAIVVPACFIVAYILHRIPGVSRIL